MSTSKKLGEPSHVPPGLVVFAVLGIALILAAVISLITFQEDWEPLGPFPVQSVTEFGDVIDVSNTVVTVEGTKCRNSDSGFGIQVQGSIGWRRLEPPGFFTTPVVFNPVVVPEGCTTDVFSNPIPVEVIDNVCQFGDSLWHIAGTETPTGEVNGRGS